MSDSDMGRKEIASTMPSTKSSRTFGAGVEPLPAGTATPMKKNVRKPDREDEASWQPRRPSKCSISKDSSSKKQTAEPTSRSLKQQDKSTGKIRAVWKTSPEETGAAKMQDATCWKSNSSVLPQQALAASEEPATTAREPPLQPGAVRMMSLTSDEDSDGEHAGVGSVRWGNLNDSTPSIKMVDESLADTLVTAITVEDHHKEREAQMEQEIRQRILEEAVQANVVGQLPLVSPNFSDDEGDEADPEAALSHTTTATEEGNLTEEDKMPVIRRKCSLWKIIVACLVAAVIGGLIVGLIVGTGDNNNISGTDNEVESITTTSPSSSVTVISDKRSTMDIVKERGYVRCGTYDLRYGFGKLNAQGEIEGINIDQCRAISLAIFGVSDRIEPVVITSSDRLQALANGTIDVLTNTVTHTMGRDVYDGQAKSGFTFSTTYLYSGLAFVGVPTFVECADALDSFYGDCRQLKICAGFGTTHYFLVKELLPGSLVIASNSPAETADFLIDGTCNAVAAEPISMIELFLRDYGYTGPYATGTKVFSKEPLALVTRQDDAEWSNLIDFIVNLFFVAEAHNISKTNALELWSIFRDDKNMASIAETVVTELGNYGDLYEKHLESILPRRGLNTLYDTKESATGLMYSFPFGYLGTVGPAPTSNGTIDTILSRGHLRCGVMPRPGFAVLSEDGLWSGFDVQFCRALAAALFLGDANAVEFVNASSYDGGIYWALSDGGIMDTLAGARVTLQAKYNEPTTNTGYTFSTPTFYDNHGDAFALMTRQDDPQWSDFVNWVVTAIVYAEEHGILQTSSGEMPVVNLFGENLKQMLRDAVLAVGNYEEIYNQTLAAILPRSGSNWINSEFLSPQQFPLPFQ